ncbi:MAG: TlpA family protein disulfide reductase [Tidjanibacter sp.]|nr:TlpA family protein disulfide reductase [Tidjanibacter sp.]
MKKIVILLAAAALCACQGKKATIQGEVAAYANKMVVLESVYSTGGMVADTVTTNDAGRFTLKVEIPGDEATFYNLHCGERTIPLILAPGDKVAVNSLPGLIDGYSVSGSEESTLVKEIKNIMAFGVAKLDSLATLYNKTTAKALRESISKDYTATYLDIKRKQIEFIVTNSGSLAAIYALNQRLPGDEVLFNGETDIVYFRLVADAVEKNYPKSTYLASLKEAIQYYDNQRELADKINEAMATPAGFPELELPDMTGKKQSLTQIQQGKVVLVDFWSILEEGAQFRQAELKKIYEKYHDKGFEIYQVAVDTAQPEWIQTLQMQKLPWISVCDFKGSASPAVMLYGVTTIPTNYLLNKEGDIVAIGAYGDNLEKELKNLFK